MKYIIKRKKYLFFTLILILFTNINFALLYANDSCDSGGGGGGDHPDESFFVNNGFVDSTYYYRTVPDVTILNEWNYRYLSSLLQSFKRSPVFTDINSSFTQLLLASKVFIIPSGGLFGMDNSKAFKDNLSEFVNQGGVLVCFSQQRGYEFSALPGGEVSGYGWTEDQSCHSNAVYIDTYHQVLSGQEKSTINMSVDGYFLTWPENTTILLRRTKNNAPAMIMYPYGQGICNRNHYV